MRKDAKYHKLLLKQSKLKSQLHTDIRSHYDWRSRNTTKNRSKIPVSLNQIEKDQAGIDMIRKRIGKSPISLFQNLKRRLRYL